jgi:hypothetical protein
VGISSLNKPKTENWELITTSSPSGLSTITLSSIDTIYAKLLVTFDLTSAGNAGFLTMRINNDSGTNYISNAVANENDQAGGSAAATDSNELLLCLSGAYSQTAWRGFAIISDASTIYAKLLTGSATASGGTYAVGTTADGFYAASAAVTQLDLLHSASLTGTVKLYGVRA